MKATNYNEENKFPYILLDDVFTDHELDGIWQELNFYSYPEKLRPPEETGSSMDQYGNVLKNNRGISLDVVYKENRIVSNILSINRRIIADNKLIPNHPSWWFKSLYADKDFTLLSYYEDGDYYRPHQDVSLVTCLFWFWKEPRKFKGGNLFFPDFDIEIEVKNNRGIIFPGMVFHAVDNIEMEEEDRGKGLGRWCMTQFLLPAAWVNPTV